MSADRAWQVALLLMMAACGGFLLASQVFREQSRPVGAITGLNDVFLGACAGWDVTTGDYDLLIGESTTTPTPTTSRFENLLNVICRQDGQPVPCPPPVPVERCDPGSVAP